MVKNISLTKSTMMIPSAPKKPTNVDVLGEEEATWNGSN